MSLTDSIVLCSSQLKSPVIADSDSQMQEAKQILLAAIAEGWSMSVCLSVCLLFSRFNPGARFRDPDHWLSVLAEFSCAAMT